MKWVWEEPDPRWSGSAGDLAKLFRNEGVKQPGLLARRAPSPNATVVAREVIQNSWDAAQDLRRELELEGVDPPPFEIEFRFREVAGSAKLELAEALDLHGLRSHLVGPSRQKLGLAPTDCLDHLDDERPLRLLEIIERGASGMYGPFESARSKLYLALISVGYTVKHEGAGGSYGFGKAGLIRGSRIHSLIAYTRFREQVDDPGVTRRLLGMTYWGPHDVDGASFTGFARLGNLVDDWVKPLENSAADQFASTFGIAVRAGDDSRQLGSTFLLIDPSVGAEELCVAVERNWWPAIVERAFSIRIVDADGAVHYPRPRLNKDLAAFVRGFELATTPQDNDVPHEHRRSLGTTTATPQPSPVGTIGLVADLDGWSFAEDVEEDDEDSPEDESRISHRSLVALVRGPRMVVEYADLGSHRPYIRGTFVADDAIDDLLRQTEPMAHDAWRSNASEEGVSEAAPRVAASVHKKIRQEVAAFRKRLKPPLPDEERLRLPLLQDLFRELVDGKGPSTAPPPPADRRPIAIRIGESLEVGEPSHLVRMRARVAFALSEHCPDEEARVRLRIEYRFLEDARVGPERCNLHITAPSEFRWDADEQAYVGRLRHEFVDFAVLSDSYAPDWSARLWASGELAESVAAAREDENEH